MENLEILKTASLFSIFQGALWVVFLSLNQKGNKDQRVILIAIFVSFCLFVLGSSLLVFGNNNLSARLAQFTNITIFIVLPLFYHLVCMKRGIARKFPQFFILHYTPFLLLILFNVVIFFTEKNFAVEDNNYLVFLITLFYVQNFYYCFCLYHLLFITQNSDSQGRTIKANDVRWIKLFFMGLVSLLLLKVLIFFVWNVLQLHEWCIIISSIFFIFSFICINSLILISLITENKLIDIKKYQNSTISESQVISCCNLLDAYLNTEKFYLDPLVSAEKVAKKLKVSSKVLSQSLNEKSKMNFHQFINHYRILEAKNLLLQESDSNILEIAYQVGFNSKSTFNTTFKSITGMTPTELKKKHLISKVKSQVS